MFSKFASLHFLNWPKIQVWGRAWRSENSSPCGSSKNRIFNLCVVLTGGNDECNKTYLKLDISKSHLKSNYWTQCQHWGKICFWKSWLFFNSFLGRRNETIPSLFDVEFDLALRNVFEICLIAFFNLAKNSGLGSRVIFFEIAFWAPIMYFSTFLGHIE